MSAPKQIAPSQLTANAPSVKKFKGGQIKDKESLRRHFTGDGSQLYIPIGDFLISYGIKLKCQDHPDRPMNAAQWSHRFKAHAAKLGMDNDDWRVVRKSYFEGLLWNFDFLYEHIEEVKEMVRQEILADLDCGL